MVELVQFTMVFIVGVWVGVMLTGLLLGNALDKEN